MLKSFWEPVGHFLHVFWHPFWKLILKQIFESLELRLGGWVGGRGGARRAEAQRTFRTIPHAGVTSLERGAADLSGCAHAADP